jgi:hypothetical protein
MNRDARSTKLKIQISQIHIFPSGSVYFYFIVLFQNIILKLLDSSYMYNLRRCAQTNDVVCNWCVVLAACCISQMVTRRECRIWSSVALEYYCGHEVDSCKIAVCDLHTQTQKQ